MITLQIRAGGFGYTQRQAAAAFPRAGAGYVLEIAARRRPAPAPRACLLASGLEAPISDGRRLYQPALAAVEADRGFSAGNGYLAGQIIDRAI